MLGLALLGCAEAPLVPLVPSHDGVAVTRRAGIELTAELKPGLQQVPAGLTAIRISVLNQRKKPIYVDVEDIQLAGDETSFSAMSAEDIRPTRTPGLGLDPASPYASAQGQVPLTGAERGLGGFSMDPASNINANPHSTDPARTWLVDSAFTGGYFERGVRERGFVYFVTPPSSMDRLTLQVKVRRAPEGAIIETLQIPYATES
jgi:hypothetical protein